MPLTIGDRLGHYDVTALIGEGSMGQVYQATDTNTFTVPSRTLTNTRLSGLRRVPASGGVAEQVTTPDLEKGARWNRTLHPAEDVHETLFDRTFLALAVPSGLIVTAQERSVAAAVRAVDSSWRHAYVTCDAAAWDALRADDLTLIHNGGSMTTRQSRWPACRGAISTHWTAGSRA